MKVAALRDLLAELPDDWLVVIDGHHVEYLTRKFECSGPRLHTEPHTCDCGNEHRVWTGEPSVAYPAAVNISARRHKKLDRSRPEPPIQFYGRWTRAQRAAIDRHSDDPDAGSEP